MENYIEISLKELLEEVGEETTREILSQFYCPNPDVEIFLKKKAIEPAKQKIAPTHLIFIKKNEVDMKLIGYYTLVNKTLKIEKFSLLSRKMKDRIKKFGEYISEIDSCVINAPLIAQLGKNFNETLNLEITGDQLLELACRRIKRVQNDIGGKVTYLECENKEILKKFYERNGFIKFATRKVDEDEEEIQGEELVQYLKYLEG
ncbi:MAG: N-acetyltransferase [Clostridium sp.]|uniref:N-acetyltransferase n=1 Tax=Clostridium sp. TaxID=1506 RepID=UPI003F2B4C1E